MLNQLKIDNIAVIESADISFSQGLNVLTGETGAGKSIVIDSIAAVIGERTTKELIRSGAEKGSVTAVFEAGVASQWLEDNDFPVDDELIIRRVISKDGKNSCRICGVPATVGQLKELSQYLLDIHGQNDGRKLLDEKSHIDYLDSFARLSSEKEQYWGELSKYKGIKKHISELEMDEIDRLRLIDSLTACVSELEEASISVGEEDRIRLRLDLLRNSEKLTENLDSLFHYLIDGDDNAYSFLNNAAFFASKAQNITDELAAVEKSINEALFLVTDAVETLKDFKGGLDFSPEEYNNLEFRLKQLSRLKRKYNRNEAGLLSLLSESQGRLAEIEYSDDTLIKLKKELAKQRDVCQKAAAALSEKRKTASLELRKQIELELKDLNMPSIRFDVEFTPLSAEPGFDSNGCDTIRFVMSANAGEPLGRISKIASGGELSRIMLAMKNVFSKNDIVQTMVFDEIDSGVSGIAAQRVGEKLFSVSQGKQVLCVTHLPQIAAMADSHYSVTKSEKNGRTFTNLSALDYEGRKRELARLHGGDAVSQLTLNSAAEQLKSCEEYKQKIMNKRN